MSEPQMLDLMAEAFVHEGVDTLFTLMGDGNMYWATAMKHLGVRLIHVRHEHSACTAAIGYHSATGKVGAASVTCGPGLTQTMTALTTAARAQVPMVVFAGEAPLGSKWYNQAIDQAPLVTATGARYIAAHSPARVLDHIREAFYVARFERVPVVIGVPMDLQKVAAPAKRPSYSPSETLLPQAGLLHPDPRQVASLADRLVAARAPIIIAGRGAVSAGAGAAIEALANQTGALLATTLPARGLFRDHPFSIGVAGGFATKVARELFQASDLVVAVGASLTYFTVDAQSLFPQALVAQIDERPVGLKHGEAAADLYVRGDAAVCVEALLQALGTRVSAATVRSDALAERIRTTPPDSDDDEGSSGALDPRRIVVELDAAIPKDWDIVSGTGHSSYFYTHMSGRAPERFHAIREFGAIGNCLGIAIGVAVARGDGKVALLEGDGALIMHIQELETIQRQGIRMLIVALNDGAFGAEIHKLRHEGVDDSQAVFGRPHFRAIAKGFGLKGQTITKAGQLTELFGIHEASETGATVWDIHITDKVVSPRMRRLTERGHP